MPYKLPKLTILAGLLLTAGLHAAERSVPAASKRVRHLLSQMSRADEMAVIHGAEEPANATLGTKRAPRVSVRTGSSPSSCHHRASGMKRFRKMSKAMFYLVLFAAASVATPTASRYYGNVTVWGALLLAFGATAGSAMTAELMTMLLRRRQR